MSEVNSNNFNIPSSLNETSINSKLNNISFSNNLNHLNNLYYPNNHLITYTPPSKNDTIIKLDVEDELNTNNEINKKKYKSSPNIRKTPNTKANLIIQKIYSNRKNVIKCLQNSKNIQLYKFNPPYTYSGTNLKNINTFNDNNNENNNDNNNENNIENNNINELNNINEMNDINDININNQSSSPSTDKSSSPSTSDESDINSKNNKNNKNNYTSHSSHYNNYNNTISNNKLYDKKKRKYYKNTKFKKIPININSINSINSNIDNNEIDNLNSSPKISPVSSPRDISDDLWNDSVENYYLEFQKLCKEESNKYKNLSNNNNIISNLLKFILLVSGCFTFTLSISIPNSLLMSTTTTVSSCLTAILTSISGFFQFDKKCEIQYNIYKELDKVYSIISLELLKPTYMRSDPYEFILSLQNRRDELLKNLQKNR
jgi:hypothetical protein